MRNSVFESMPWKYQLKKLWYWRTAFEQFERTQVFLMFKHLLRLQMNQHHWKLGEWVELIAFQNQTCMVFSQFPWTSLVYILGTFSTSTLGANGIGKYMTKSNVHINTLRCVIIFASLHLILVLSSHCTTICKQDPSLEFLFCNSISIAVKIMNDSHDRFLGSAISVPSTWARSQTTYHHRFGLFAEILQISGILLMASVIIQFDAECMVSYNVISFTWGLIYDLSFSQLIFIALLIRD